MIIDNRKIIINNRATTSSYGFANKDRLMELQINRTIGSGLTSVNKIMANADEQKAIMPDIIGVAGNNADWNKETRNYWNSFTYEVAESGKELEIGFMYDINTSNTVIKEFIDNYNKKVNSEKDKLTTDEDLRDYIDNRLKYVINSFKKQISTLDSIKDAVTRDKLESQAYSTKYTSIVSIEGDRYKIGRPIDASEYMLYRYLLGYSPVANEEALMNKSPNIRFYLTSEEDIKKEKKSRINRDRTRMSLLLEVTKDIASIENLLYAMHEVNIPTDDIDKHELVEKLSVSRADEFIRIAGDKNLILVGTIEKYIAFGLLDRAFGSQIIYNPNSTSTDPIGNNIEEVIKYFNNPSNKVTISELDAKFKTLII